MRITLKQLTESFESLGKFASDESLTIKQKHWLSRIAGAVESENRSFLKHRDELIKKHGEEKDGGYRVPAAKLEAYQAELDDFLTAEIELPGDPIKLDTLSDAVKINAIDLLRLNWLICE